ncbi:MAG: hypothetical protein JSR34_00225 [Proteobacteria bacterium]|nr:hypothetical protein [Pseudomonadota bacterium]
MTRIAELPAQSGSPEQGEHVACGKENSRYVLLAACLMLLGLAIRSIYVLVAQVDFPIRGDSNEYVLYAWNWVHRGIYSMALPTDTSIEPSGFRAPGYPWLIAAAMRWAGHSDLPFRQLPNGLWTIGYVSDAWMRCVMFMQVLMGAASVGLSMAVARFWLRPGFSLLVGALVALWPQSVTFTGALLSETLFSFTLLLAFWMFLYAKRHASNVWMSASGFMFGIAYLVNPVVGLFPLLCAFGMFWRRASRNLGIALAVSALLAPIGWSVARHADPTGMGATQRAEIAFVVGSWPDYYSAYAWRFKEPSAAWIVAQESREQDAFMRDRAAGLAMIRARFAEDPAAYVQWYLLRKPFLYWDWALRIGASDIAFPETRHSPYDVYASFRAMRSVFERLNPVFFWFALAGVLWTVAGSLRSARSSVTTLPVLPAALLIYVTVLHSVLQAEPRYSLAFRPFEFLMFAWVLQYVLTFLGYRMARGRQMA